MCDIWKVNYHNAEIGSAEVCREGLYYRIDCKCKFHDKGIYRLTAEGAKGTVDLGICIPLAQDSWGLSTRVPISKLGLGAVTITAKSKEENISTSKGEEQSKLFELKDLDKAYLDGGELRIKD